VSAYLERSSRDPKADARVVAGFASPELAGELPARWEERAPRQAVRSAVVSGAVALDARRVLVTVAATVAAARVSAWLVTVPVARDAGGGLVVYDLPSLAPALATVGRELGEPLLGSEGAEVRDVLSRFLRAYLAGDAAAGCTWCRRGHGSGRRRAGSSWSSWGWSPRPARAIDVSAAGVGDGPRPRCRVAGGVRAALPGSAPPPRSLVCGGP
jgi:hypothetical protein